MEALSFKQHFHRAADIIYFDHGGYSLMPHRVRDYQTGLRETIDRNPSGYFRRELVGDLEACRSRIATFLDFPADRLCFTPNASHSFNMIMKNLRLGTDDSILISNELYAGNRSTLEYVSSEYGVQLKVVNTQGVYCRDLLIDRFLEQIDVSTKVVILDHVASPSGRLLPVRDIAAALKEAGLTVIIDGSQAVGTTALSLRQIPFDFYFGNHHKWISAPRSSSFIAFSEDWSKTLRGLVTGAGDVWKGQGQRVHQDTNFPGAYDPTALLSVPVALDFVEEFVPGGWLGCIEQNHQNLIAGLSVLTSYLEVQPVVPEAFFTSMVLCSLPSLASTDHTHLAKKLHEDHIVIQVFSQHGVPHIRVCNHIYTSSNDYHRLGQSLAKLCRV